MNVPNMNASVRNNVSPEKVEAPEVEIQAEVKAPVVKTAETSAIAKLYTDHLADHEPMQAIFKEDRENAARLRDLAVLSDMPDLVAYDLAQTPAFKGVKLNLDPKSLTAVRDDSMNDFVSNQWIIPKSRLARAMDAILDGVKGFASCVAATFGAVIGSIRKGAIKVSNWVRGIKPQSQMSPSFQRKFEQTKKPSKDEARKALEAKAAKAKADAEALKEFASKLNAAELKTEKAAGKKAAEATLANAKAAELASKK